MDKLKDANLNTAKLISKLKRQLFGLCIFAFSFILFFTFYLNKIRITEIAEIILSQTKENLIIRNIRPVVISLDKISTKPFNYIKFTDKMGKIVFSIPQSYEKNQLDTLNQNISLPVIIDGDSNSEIGTLEFGYSTASILIFAIIIWLTLLFVSRLIFLRYEKQLINEQNYFIKIRNAETMSSLAKQVAHDIRSPLAALNMIMSQVQTIPEQQRLIIRNSVNRITDIANTLINKKFNQLNSNITFNEKKNLQPELLSTLVEAIVSEKRIQFRDKINVEIEIDFSNAYGVFAILDSTELKRVISNLINNSIEAFTNSTGKVSIIISRASDQAIITVSDNGKGIPKVILEKLGASGVTYGKEGTDSGSGLGIYHAKETIEGVGGTFQIESIEGVGTTITIKLPATKPPQWFLEKLILDPGKPIISLDDDLSIHGIWESRFFSIQQAENNFKHFTFTSLSDFKSNIKKLLQNNINFLVLIDYELINQNQNGIDVIEELGIKENSILVTSRFDDLNLREKCQNIHVKIIPKSLAPLVPIEIKTPKILYDIVLIDDDDIIHMSWKLMAKEMNKRIVCFFNPIDFFNSTQSINYNSPIYIDSNLGNQVKGEDISKKAFELGFKTIFLCTGYDASEFKSLTWLSGIVGKDFPLRNQ